MIGPPLDSTALSLSQVVARLRNGGADMPAYARTLTAREIADVAAFVVEPHR